MLLMRYSFCWVYDPTVWTLLWLCDAGFLECEKMVWLLVCACVKGFVMLLQVDLALVSTCYDCRIWKIGVENLL